MSPYMHNPAKPAEALLTPCDAAMHPWLLRGPCAPGGPLRPPRTDDHEQILRRWRALDNFEAKHPQGRHPV
eukprot:scaffold313744_cov23-Tisochrysis_lutea.AAC.1